jgi:hypothetical protein
MDYQASYGFVSMLGNSVPEVKNLLARAVAEKWSPDRFSMAVASTSWWRNTAAADREWIVQVATDPKTANLQKQVGADDVRNRATSLGIAPPDQQHSEILWLQKKLYGWSDDQLNAAMFAHYRRGLPQGSQLAEMQKAGGKYGQVVNEMMGMAQNYGYVSGDWTKPGANGAVVAVMDAANKIMEHGGQASTDEFKSKMVAFASSKYQPFADRIRAGETVNDIAAPYRQAISETLELNDKDVGLDDKLLNAALQGSAGPDGKLQGMAVYQVQKQAREDLRWRKTNNARDSAAQTATALGKMFGKVSG